MINSYFRPFLFIIFVGLTPIFADVSSDFKQSDTSELLIVRDKSKDLEEFRLISAPFSLESNKDNNIVLFNDNLPTNQGLEKLKVSGSAQFSEKGLSEILDILNLQTLVLFDLREEPHGFINQIPVSWMKKNGDWPNLADSPREIEDDEKELLKKALKEKNITIYKVIKNRSEDDEIFRDEFVPIPIEVQNISTERNLSAKLGLAYFRIPVTDHEKSRDNDVDAFLKYYLSRPDGSWTHLHCRGGRGRTSTFFIIVDMIHNAKTVSFEDIMDRQMLISQINFIVPKSILQKKHNKAFFERLDFLKEFYKYCKENDDNFKTSWTKWKHLDSQKVDNSYE
jgi:hypothetical protein